MPKSQIGIAVISNCSDLMQSANGIATKIASKSLEKRAELAVIGIVAISNR